MAHINQNYLKLPGSYLFSEVNRRITAYSASHPGAKIIRLSIGDVPRHRRSPLEQDLIARAKALLMERDGLTEEQAHRTLQKRSMDQGLTLVQTARRTLAQGGG